MSDRIIVINELELLVQQCFSTLDDFLLIQKFSENDARVTFFKHIVNVIDSAGEFGYHCAIHPFMTGVVMVD